MRDEQHPTRDSPITLDIKNRTKTNLISTIFQTKILLSNVRYFSVVLTVTYFQVLSGFSHLLFIHLLASLCHISFLI
jgi:hypothetical protein